MATSLALLTLFLFFSILMVNRWMPAMLALPCLGLAVAMVVGLHHHMNWSQLQELMSVEILGKGSVAMARSIVVAIFGGALAQLVTQKGMTRALVASAAEYGGDHKVGIGIAMLVVVAINFTSLSGVAAILLVGNLVLPILISVGFSPRFAGTLMLFGVALGGLVNPLSLQIFVDIFKVDFADCLRLSTHYLILLGGVAMAYLLFQTKRERRFAWASPVPTEQPPPLKWWALLTPALPLLLMGLFQVTPLPAILLSLVYGSLITQPRQCLASLSQALIEGIREVAPVIALFIGLGVALEAFRHPLSEAALGPLVAGLTPQAPLAFVLGFTLLAPMATYRGPLTLYGLGGGVAVLLVKSQVLPVTALLAAFLCLGQFQSICDPTCTHNVCVGQIVKESPERLALHALVWVWTFVLLATSWAVWGQGILNPG